MQNEEDDFTLEDLDKLETIFRILALVLGFIVIGFIIWAGLKGWAWYIAIPVGSALFFGCRILKRMFVNQAQHERQKIRRQGEHHPDEKDKISFDEFMDMSPQESDDEKLALLRLKQQKTKKTKPYQNILAASFVMLMVGVFWYGVGRIIALSVSGN
jgi:hypothetical protein